MCVCVYVGDIRWCLCVGSSLATSPLEPGSYCVHWVSLQSDDPPTLMVWVRLMLLRRSADGGVFLLLSRKVVSGLVQRFTLRFLTSFLTFQGKEIEIWQNIAEIFGDPMCFSKWKAAEINIQIFGSFAKEYRRSFVRCVTATEKLVNFCSTGQAAQSWKSH